MPLTVSPSLHRFVPRRALETTAYGYEVVARSECLSDCISTVQWIDCWCPDAAQFILVEASEDLATTTCGPLIEAISDTHLHRKIRLVCSAESLRDLPLVDELHRHDIGFLLRADITCDLERLAQRGILGVWVGGEAIDSRGPIARGVDLEGLVSKVQELGLRAIASQVPSPDLVRSLMEAGYDYVSQRDQGFIPSQPSFAWQRRVV